jgi:hypothetical protein
MEKGDRVCKKAFWTFLSVLCLVVSAFGQSQPDASQQSSSQTQSQTPPEPKKRETLGDASHRSGKDKAKPKKVYTEEDLSGMRGDSVSVVGGEKPAESGAAGSKTPDGNPKAGVVPMSGQDEVYWRGKARALLDEIARTDEQITKLKDDLKKYGAGGFDVTTGMKDNVAYIEDRNGQVKELEKRKADLEKKLDQLEEAGRKAGAPPAWFR